MITENHKRVLNMIVCWGSWFSAIGIATWVVFFTDPLHPVRGGGLTVIILMGVAITASLIRSRYKLADTITEVFRQGVKIGQAHEALRQSQEDRRA